MSSDEAERIAIGARFMGRGIAGTVARAALAMLSFVIYVIAVLSMHQERTVPFLIEQDGPIPVVVSHWLYGAPFALADSGVHRFFVSDFRSRNFGVTADTAVEHAFQAAAPPRRELSIPRSGTGIDGPIAVELAFLSARFRIQNRNDGPQGLAMDETDLNGRYGETSGRRAPTPP